MKINIRTCCFCSAIASVVMFMMGCLSNAEWIEKRIAERQDYFTTLPAETQTRIRSGRLQVGDTADDAWLVYGAPTRVYNRLTATSTNEVWSYVTTDIQPVDEFRPVYYPIMSRGQTYWAVDHVLQRSYIYDRNEYLRIELNNKKVIAIENTGLPQ